VIAAAGSDSKLALAASKGALPAGINYTGADGKAFRLRLKDALGGNTETSEAKGIDLFVDNVGGDYLEAGMRSMSWNGRAVVVGFAGGKIPSIPANILLLKNISVSGLFWGAHMQFQYDLFQSSCDDLVAMWAAGEIHPHVSHRVPLQHINEALRLVASRESTGKVIVTMD
jgi:NADPH2:quinone reductase